MLSKELVEQHCVHCLVTHGVWVAFRVMGHEVGIYPFDLLGYETELRRAVDQFLFLYRNATGRSARMASLAISIELMSILKRCDEAATPSYPFESILTGEPAMGLP